MIRWLVNKIKRHDAHSKMFYYGNKYLRTLSQEDLDKFHKYAHQLEDLEGEIKC